MGYSRQQFSEIQRNFQLYGAEGLLDRLPGATGPHPNRVAEAVEKAVLEYSLGQKWTCRLFAISAFGRNQSTLPLASAALI